MPCDLIFPIFTAASTLLHESRQKGMDLVVDNRAQLRLCLYWLSVFGNNWKSAGERQKMFNERKYTVSSGSPAWTNTCTVVDLPAQLDPPKDPILDHRQGPRPPASLASPAHNPYPVALHAASDALTPTGFSDILTTVDDWRFLDVFGHADDTFYAIDAELRTILEGQIVDNSTDGQRLYTGSIEP